MVTISYLSFRIAVLICALRQVYCGGVNPLLEEWERFLTSAEDAPHSAPSSSRDSSSRTFHLAIDPYDSGTSWSDILGHTSSTEPATSDHHVYTELDHDLNVLLSEQHKAPQEHEAASLQPHTVLRGVAPQLTQDKRLEVLDDAKLYIYTQVRTTDRARNIADALPARPDMSLEGFATFVNGLEEIDRRYGVWPIEIKGERYLLNQMLTTWPSFQAVSDLVVNPARPKYFIAVSKEVGPPNSGVFEYAGTFQAPYREDFKLYKDRTLFNNAFQVKEVQTLGPYTFHARLQKYL